VDGGTLFGGGGDDVLRTSNGGATVDGGEGSDTIYLGHTSASVVNTITDSGSAGYDIVYLTNAMGGHTLQSDFSAASGIEEVSGSLASGYLNFGAGWPVVGLARSLGLISARV
jgi:hypothetical protein